jgi:hypothetical protein
MSQGDAGCEKTISFDDYDTFFFYDAVVSPAVFHFRIDDSRFQCLIFLDFLPFYRTRREFSVVLDC